MFNNYEEQAEVIQAWPSRQFVGMYIHAVCTLCNC